MGTPDPQRAWQHRGRLLLAGLTVTALGAASLYWLGGDRGAAVEEASDGAERPSAPAGEPDESPQVRADVPEAGDPLWREADESAVRELPAYPRGWSTDDRVLVRVTGAASAARSWQVGDPLTIPMPQIGDTYRPIIDVIDDGPGGSRSVLGNTLGSDGMRHRFVVTVGPMSMFAYISTPAGAYELMAGTDYGWLVPTASIMAGVDFSQPDYILPDDTVRGLRRLVPSQP